MTMSPSLEIEGDSDGGYLVNGAVKRKRQETPDVPSALQPDIKSNDAVYDLICIGFGPASLAIAIALHDSREDAGSIAFKPRVCFLEKQEEFRWHSGMMLPNSKMQISFLKDLAMQRNPRSYFTFLNYLKINNRLAQFTNLSTFLPTRFEFEDYMKWCASKFTRDVEYGSKVISIEPAKSQEDDLKHDLLTITYVKDHKNVIKRARKIVIAVGGHPSRPEALPESHSRVIHSSVYADHIGELLKNREKAYNIGVLGSGQSAAEVYHDLHHRYPKAHTSLIFRDSALRPSDASPFVNEIFNDDRITPFFATSLETRQQCINKNRSTNYSVIHPELLERIYHDQYQQRIQEPNENCHRNRLYPSSTLVSVIDRPQNKRVDVLFKSPTTPSSTGKTPKHASTTLSLDLLVYATGYTRDLYTDLLRPCQLLNDSAVPDEWEVARDYSVKLNRELVDDKVQIYLQGCNEKTHGLSDSLISVLAVRAGEIVQSIFGERLKIKVEN